MGSISWSHQTIVKIYSLFLGVSAPIGVLKCEGFLFDSVMIRGFMIEYADTIVF